MNLNAGGSDPCLLEDCGFQFQRGATEHYWAWWRFRLGGISKLRAAYFDLDRGAGLFPTSVARFDFSPVLPFFVAIAQLVQGISGLTHI